VIHVTAECVALFATAHEVERYTRPMTEDEFVAFAVRWLRQRGCPALHAVNE
jgi:hypothetical protein